MCSTKYQINLQKKTREYSLEVNSVNLTGKSSEQDLPTKEETPVKATSLVHPLHNRGVPRRRSLIDPTIKSKVGGSHRISSIGDLKVLLNSQISHQKHKLFHHLRSNNSRNGNQKQYGNFYRRIDMQSQSQPNLKPSTTTGTTLKEQSRRSGFQKLHYMLRGTMKATHKFGSQSYPQTK